MWAPADQDLLGQGLQLVTPAWAFAAVPGWWEEGHLPQGRGPSPKSSGPPPGSSCWSSQGNSAGPLVLLVPPQVGAETPEPRHMEMLLPSSLPT